MNQPAKAFNEYAKNLNAQTIFVAKRWLTWGLITQDEFEAYVHRWQTSAVRSGPRQCQCDECKLNYPTLPGEQTND